MSEEPPPRRAPSLVLTRAGAVAFVTVSYVGTAALGKVLFESIALARGADASEAHVPTAAFAALMVLCWLTSLVLVLREPARGVRRG